jgi:acylphosphatase
MSDRRVRVVVDGRVQGVFFRSTVQDRADELGVSGWVTNRSDGRVEAEFQGSEDQVEQLVALCREGPGRADVADVAVETIDPVEGERGFSVR